MSGLTAKSEKATCRAPEERRETDEADESRMVARRKIEAMVVDCCVPDGNGAGGCILRSSIQHDDGSGDRVSGEWPAGFGGAGSELAFVHDGERPTGRGRENDGDDCAGWIREPQSHP